MAEKDELAGRGQAPVKAAPDTDAIVNEWFQKYFPNSPIARSDECWLLLSRAVADLKQLLKGA
jgi:hypothetical protein